MHPSLFRQQLIATQRALSVAELEALGITRGVRQGPRWQRTARGHYVPTDRSGTTAQRIIDQLPLLPDGGAVGGWAAAFVQGVDWLDGVDLDGQPLPVPLCVGPDLRRRSNDRVRYARDRLSLGDVGVWHGLPVTDPIRTAFDAGRWADGLVESVVVLDAMAHFGLVALADLRTFSAGIPRTVRRRQIREALALADPAVRSPWESRLRMVYMLDAGLPRPLVNPPVFDDRGRFVAIPDLRDPEAGLVLEYDGSGHRERRQHNDDNVREEALERVGLTVVRADSFDYRHRRARLVARMRDGSGRGMARDRRRDRWTLATPEWALDPYQLTDEDKEVLFGAK